MPSSPPAPDKGVYAKVILATLVGAAFGRYAGIHLAIPAALSALAWYLARRFGRPTDTNYLPAMALMAGHAAWIFAGLAIIGRWSYDFSDVLVFGGGVLWLWHRPGAWPVVVLTVLELLCIALNVASFLEPGAEPFMQKALAVHVMLRAGAVFFMARAWWQSRQRAAADALARTAAP